ncbi:ATP-dependent 3'-5' DNA helicase [Sorochytrium milnesiophthora]
MFPIGRKRRGGSAGAVAQPSAANKRRRGQADAATSASAQQLSIAASRSPLSVSEPSPTTAQDTGPPEQLPAQAPQEPLTDLISQLVRMFEALNTTYTFLSARRGQEQLRLTYDMVKSSVEQSAKQPFELQHVRMLCALAPDMLDTFYIDADALKERVDEFSSSPSKKPSHLQELRVLIEFVSDRAVVTRAGKRKGLIIDHGKPGLASINASALKSVIEARNLEFKTAVQYHLTRCRAEGRDPDAVMQEAASAYLSGPENEGAGRQSTSSPSKQASRLNLSAPKPEIPVPTLNPSEDLTHISMQKVLTMLKGCKADQPQELGEITPVTKKPSLLNFAYQNQIAHEQVVPTRQAQTVKLTELTGFSVSAELRGGLERFGGITELYSHQAAAIEALQSGSVTAAGEETGEQASPARHVIVATSTSSGKSLIYQIPLLHALEQDKETCIFYICPTKALAQDQLRSLTGLVNACPHLDWVKVATYDGDTPADMRQRIRDESSVIFTNPDMLHVSIMPSCSSSRSGAAGSSPWGVFLRNLRFVIVDELHYYHGVFGSHCALIFRRLRRLCEHYGNTNLQFIACSATIANPVEHASNVFGVPESSLTLIDKDGSPSGQRTYVFWNPPVMRHNLPEAKEAGESSGAQPAAIKAPPAKPKDTIIRRVPALSEAARLFIFFITKHVRTLAFARTRKACELLFREVCDQLESCDETSHLRERIKAYRGGYHVEERRAIEKGLFTGELLGVVATNALELGVDIGGIEAVLHMGYPGNAAMRQQAGRAGRRQRDCVSVLIAEAHPVDQYYMRQPQKLLIEEYDSASIDAENKFLLESHLKCAAFEMPVRLDSDAAYFGDVQEQCEKVLVERQPHAVWETEEQYPARQVVIRSIDQDTFTVYDVTTSRQRVLEEIESYRAAFTLYTGAVFLNQGKSYLVLDVNPDERFAKVRKTTVPWITSSKAYQDIDPIKAYRTKSLQPDVVAGYGEVNVTTHVYAYNKQDVRTKAIMEQVPIETVPIVKMSKGCWIDVPMDIVRYIESFSIDAIYDAMHVASHLLASLLGSMIISTEKDIMTECPAKDRDRPRPFRLILVDQHAGGTGAAKKAYEQLQRLLERALDVAEGCLCAEGCPDCIFWDRCGSHNERLHKANGIILLRRLLRRQDPVLLSELTDAPIDPDRDIQPDEDDNFGFADENDDEFEAALCNIAV